MKPNGPVRPDNPLLIGRVRTGEETDPGEGGDIVVMREKRDGVERVKIFQRKQQDDVARFFFRLYDNLRGNVNCTALLEKKAQASKNAGDHFNDHPQLALQNALRSIRQQVESATDIRQSGKDLLLELTKLGIPIDGSNACAEIAEPRWDGQKLNEELQSRFRQQIPAGSAWSESLSSWEWLAQCRDDPHRVFAGREIERAREIHAVLSGMTDKPSPEQARALRELDRLAHDMSDHAIEPTSNFQVDRLYRCVLSGAHHFTLPKFEAEMQPLLSALKFPDQPLSSLQSEQVCNNLATLRAYWDTLSQRPDLKLSLMPVVFKLEQDHAERIKTTGMDTMLRDSFLKADALAFIADDIRKCIAEELEQRQAD